MHESPRSLEVFDVRNLLLTNQLSSQPPEATQWEIARRTQGPTLGLTSILTKANAKRPWGV
jgi:hypothetical protein